MEIFNFPPPAVSTRVVLLRPGVGTVPRFGYRKNKPGIDFLSPRFVSTRFDSIRSARSAGSGKSGWLLPVGFFLSSVLFFFLFGGIHTFGCSFVRVDGLLIIFCSDAFSFVDNYAISRHRTFTDTTNFKSHQFPSFPKIGLKQLTFGLSNCESSGTRISS